MSCTAMSHAIATTESPIAILGAGSWGTALAILLARNQQTVRLWGNDAAELETMQITRCNHHYLPDILLPENLLIQPDLEAALTDAQDILVVVPSHAFRAVLQRIKPYFNSTMRLAWGTKGLDPQSAKLLDTVVNEVFGTPFPTAVISGPSFAREVAMGLPTAVTVASNTQAFAKDLAKRLHNSTFRVYTSADVIGVEVGGAIKNILAIATGISDGLGFGANARSALITRGLAEMIRLGIALGGQLETFMGLAGVGDLILTCTDNQSRNRRFGLALGQGTSIHEAEKTIGQVVEGARNVIEAHKLAQKTQISMPITEQVYRVLYQGIAPAEAVKTLLMREPKVESD